MTLDYSRLKDIGGGSFLDIAVQHIENAIAYFDVNNTPKARDARNVLALLERIDNYSYLIQKDIDTFPISWILLKNPHIPYKLKTWAKNIIKREEL
jgi:hypothetical protein